ncbi:acetyl-CoA C-acetyltransferase [Actinokineospora diospyrosa]|uniref:Probable acetyl-CoA acetyltransferase n=1 Tax=Actinokineospora diospyrosa TaxID=103728 RepID=A0ABT1IJW4_9PSEU|nr:acetyl-CoA C-acetyltransferase [Actinokineospora diospyrosa]MCP2272854.1 acetyl-CoA C-acetyltransferase [Actinokineospora diospyrosa]
MREAVICEPLRTPVGRFGGVFTGVGVTTLAAAVLGELVRRTGVDPALVEDVVFGQCHPNGDAPALGRVAALDAGLPISVPGTQVDRRCGSGLQAVLDAAMRVQTGVNDVVIAGGAENMSQVEFYSTAMRWGVKGTGVELHDRLARARVTAGGVNHPVPGGMVETAENLRRDYGISRAEQDELSLRSHQRAVAAITAGRFDDEVVAVGEVTRDEHPRADASLESLAKLKPIMRRQDPDATVTAGNASGQNDGAAACLVTTPELAADLGLRPFARLVSWSVSGVDPARMGLGPVPATARALERAGLTLADIDLIELNEAFAAQVIAVTREWNFKDADWDRTNVNGSGISLGHPLGATGARVLATLLHQLRRADGRYALETMCIGGGQGLAAVFERV